MSVVVWIAAASFAGWLWMLVGQGFFWRTDLRLPPRAEPEHWPSVAVVVPARDEAEVLPTSLPSLLAQDYPGHAEVYLVDDGSTDGTGELARGLAERTGGLALTVTSPGEPPAGWTGKLWAVRHGMERARARAAGRHTDAGPQAGAESPTDAGSHTDAEPHTDAGPHVPAPEYLLLTDADIAHAPDSLRTLVAAARTGGYDLVSQMARLRVASGWERLIVPAFVYFFAQLYPFRWIGRKGGRTAAAAGGCVLLRADAAERARVPDAIRHAVIDDVALARAVKRTGGHIWLGLADRVDSVRPYPRLAHLWRMVARSAYAQLRHSPAVLVVTVAGLAVVYLAPPVTLVAGIATGSAGAAVFGGLAWLVMTATYLPMLRYYRQPLWLALTLPATAFLYLLMTVDSAVQHYRGRGAAWKGRTYTRPGTTAPEESRP
ncbi:glycosyltransferase [Streptomyces sp. p1417]|uniref:Glycosyltransferase n=1 Tax=Streptomyces typhae TaxID=2681492 RepID=A0A6L6X264_9ACTN|nr:glycosyltransferase [Streptomyces typhae]MVO87720.1 glycosyltransferase [Streptomyces typhae]